ncbi:MAG: transcription antitermination factor NusB [Candidatus Edwardsbacteria bacterium]|jgi:N utilization substance protein B|nr:transcription antitermination factor NusB [Candidatus Edwardsbacteria bacterium]
MGARRLARELALQALYQHDIAADPVAKLARDLHRRYHETADPEALSFAAALVRTVLDHRPELDRLIAGSAQNWRMDRMAVIDRNILRLGAAQLLHCRDQVPPKVAIDESIELAKRYGDDQSGRFINGILDRIFRDLPGHGDGTAR